MEKNLKNAQASGTRKWRALGYLFIGIAVISSMAAVAIYVNRADTLPITQLRVVGEFENVKAEQIKNTVKRHLHGNLVTVDIDAIHGAVSKIPWVNFVWIDRVWPNTLQVRVVEEKAIAYWEGSGLVNRDGIVFVNADNRNRDLPVIAGPGGTEKILLEQFLIFRDMLESAHLSIERLAMNDRHAWSMTLNNGVEVIIGREQSYARLLRFLRIYQENLATSDKALKRVDLRYANGFALGFSS